MTRVFLRIAPLRRGRSQVFRCRAAIMHYHEGRISSECCRRIRHERGTGHSYESADHRRRRLHRLAPGRALARPEDLVLVIDNYVTGWRDNLALHAKLTLVEGTIADADLVRRVFRDFGPDHVVQAAASY
jgi:hypothetical protein